MTNRMLQVTLTLTMLVLMMTGCSKAAEPRVITLADTGNHRIRKIVLSP